MRRTTLPALIKSACVPHVLVENLFVTAGKKIELDGFQKLYVRHSSEDGAVLRRLPNFFGKATLYPQCPNSLISIGRDDDCRLGGEKIIRASQTNRNKASLMTIDEPLPEFFPVLDGSRLRTVPTVEFACLQKPRVYVSSMKSRDRYISEHRSRDN